MKDEQDNFNIKPLSPGMLLFNGRYRILHILGRGGFGITYEAEQSILGRRVAIKEFFPKGSCERSPDSALVTSSVSSRADFERYRSKFLKEARTMAGMVHPHIVRIIDLFEENGTAYYVMDYLPGGSLSDMVKRSGPLPPDTAVRYVREVGGALSFLHGHRINHLDVKPGNILLDGEGHAVLIDFGLSKHYDSDGRETSNTPVGISAGYAPLEQYEDGGLSGFSPESDIYALGATLYYLLSGKRPPAASDVLNRGLPRPSARIPDALWSSILKSMSPGRTSRPRSIDEFLSLPGLSGSSSGKDEGLGADSTWNGEETETNRGKGTWQSNGGAGKKDSSGSGKGVSDGESQPFFRRHRKTLVLAVLVAVVAVIAMYLILSPAAPVAVSEPIHNEEINDYGYKPKSVTAPSDSADQPPGQTPVQEPKHEQMMGSISEPKTAEVSAPPRRSDFSENVNGVSFDMVYVSGGQFSMGSNNGNDRERPVHDVVLDGYYIGRHEVTQKLWTAVMGSNPSSLKGDDLPVDNVSWNDVQRFIVRLNNLTGKKYRLPTEAEWEYASKGGATSVGYRYSGSDNLSDVAWHRANSDATPHPVGRMQPNELGLYDMSGNVWEWCSDWYGEYASSSQKNPKGSSNGKTKVLRGGSWNDYSQVCRPSNRSYNMPSYKNEYCGFRLSL